MVGYPADREADVLLADGGVVHLRPARPDDEAAIRAMHRRLSARTIELRFFESFPRLLDHDVARVLSADRHDRVALLATLGEDVVGLAYYSRSGERDEAEIAFLIEDAHQGRGLGSIVLEHLAVAGREAGLLRFTAEVLPGNRAMIAVFRDAGFDVEARFDSGAIRLSVDLEPTPRSREVMRAREQHAEARSVARMLTPRSVAVIGASRRPGTAGYEIFRRIVEPPFAGPVYPVNPTAGHVAGVLAYPSILDVPGNVDVAFVVTPPEPIFEVIRQCARKGVHALVVLSSGFAETGAEGRARQEALVALARSHGMRLVGPACMGIMNTDPAVSLNGTLVPRLPRRGRVGFFAQSGALSADVLARAVARGVGVSVLVSAGNRADVSGNDLLQYWLDDPSTDVVLLYLETFGNPRKFARLARAVSRRKPVVAVQAVAPRDRTRSEAMFRQAGVIRVDTLGELLDVATLLSRTALPEGNRVAIIGNMMSLGGIAAAACAVHDLEVAGGQPVDLGAVASVDDLAEALTRALADPEVDAVVTAFVPPLKGPEASGRVIERLAAGSRKPVLVTSPGVFEGGVPSYSSPEEAVRALAHAVRYARWRDLPVGGVPVLGGIDRRRAAAVMSGIESADGTEPAAESLLSLLDAYGIPAASTGSVPEGVAVTVGLSDDAVFGRALSFGIGGIVTDLLEDRSWRALPMTDADAARMVREVRAAPVLFGYGGRPPVDVVAVENLLMRLARIGTDLPQFSELRLTAVCAGDRVEVLTVRGSLTPPTELDEGPRRLD
ncbi:GNAT family N-acetyltransferase [Streptosporangium sp. NPDC002544]|uniref:bifunctional acetate--CoA ligase family protein/GNAT family N-acetyltransferase n=1 Tax=Streptosporangium sp. NPDC002544 TaxID=3154538 RepID=UPI003327BE12